MKKIWREVQFDGLVGSTHNYGGLSFGNLASQRHRGLVSNPRAAFLQGLEKMRYVSSLGVVQALLPPHERPRLRALRALGFKGSDEEVLVRVSKENELWLRLASSASSMWTANAATVLSSKDSSDGLLHLVPANLQSLYHRALEADQTTRVLKKIFSNPQYFCVHEPLPPSIQLADEGAANHIRLETSKGRAHLFAWGRSAYQKIDEQPKVYPARQTLEASEGLARLLNVRKSEGFFPQQAARGIDAGCFHTDVAAVGNQHFLMLHEYAFVDQKKWIRRLKKLLGPELVVIEASERELPISIAVKTYPFNSQILSLPTGEMAIIAPKDSEENPKALKFLRRVVEEGGPVDSLHFLDVRQSMQNGGGPACLRLRVLMNEEEARAVRARVFLTEALYDDLKAWGEKYYRDRLHPQDLGDPDFVRESMIALDELTQILRVGSIYDFQM